MITGNGTERVGLAHLPIGVRARLIVANQVELGTALSPEAAALAGTGPSLVDLELVGRTVEGEGGCIAMHRLGAVVDEVAVEKVRQLVGITFAPGLVRQVWVL